MLLATVADCKVIARINTTADDALVAIHAAAVAASIEAWLGIEMYNDTTDRTEKFHGVPYINGRIKLMRRPVAYNAAPLSTTPDFALYEDISGGYDATTLLSTDEYDLDMTRGVVTMRYRRFLSGKGSLKAVYKGGYLQSGTTGVLTVPDAIRMAALLQFQFAWARKDAPASSGLATAMGNVARFMSFDLREDVKQLLAPYARRDC